MRPAGSHGDPPAATAVTPTRCGRARQAKGESITAIARHLKIGRSILYRAVQDAAEPSQEEPTGIQA